MCGIVGIFGPLADSVGERWLPAATAALHHRGPDGAGTWRDDRIGLGHARLAILDLSDAGAQPMRTPDGALAIAYNGEVYNHGALSKPLLERGFRPRGHSDTEVILHHLGQHGADGLADLNGMFALALYDKRDGSLLLARDRAGIKPLYYAVIDNSVAFCSELLPLLDLPGLDKTLDTTSLGHYLALGLVPPPGTIVRGIKQLAPGELLVARPGNIGQPRRFCGRIGVPQRQVPGDPVEQDRELERLLREAVRDQLEADVPVGVLLSGGVDSSVVAAAASMEASDIRTFAVVHEDPRYDEREAAQAVARHIGSQHTEIPMPPGGLTEDELHALVAHHGDPFADSSSLPTRRLAREVRKHVTVALSGDGGDELFAGYPRFWQMQAVQSAALLPHRLAGRLQQGAEALSRAMPQGAQLAPRRVSRALGLAQRPVQERAVGTQVWFWPDEQHALLRPGFAAPTTGLADLVESCAAPGFSLADADGAHRMEQHLGLPADMLTKVDRMTMAESLEIRPPLLDNRILAFAAALPIQRKVQGRQCKAILKALARRWVPPEVVDRPKKGFAVPLIDYGGDVLADATRWALTGGDSPLQHLFNDGALARLQAEFQRRGEGSAAEDSEYRRMHRQWAVTVLALALQKTGAAL